MKKFHTFGVILLLVTSASYSDSSYARNRYPANHEIEWGYHPVYLYAQKENIISSGQAKKLAEERFGGKALSATLEKYENGNSAYRVKMINGGRVKVVTIQANP